MIDYLLNHLPITGGIVVSFLMALLFVYTARRAMIRDRFNIVNIPRARSCFDCDSHFVLTPQSMPADSAQAVAVLSKVARCREMILDETRLPEEQFQKDWEWAFEQAPGDYTAIATRCPKFRVIQGGKR